MVDKVGRRVFHIAHAQLIQLLGIYYMNYHQEYTLVTTKEEQEPRRRRCVAKLTSNMTLYIYNPPPSSIYDNINKDDLVAA